MEKRFLGIICGFAAIFCCASATTIDINNSKINKTVSSESNDTCKFKWTAANIYSSDGTTKFTGTVYLFDTKTYPYPTTIDNWDDFISYACDSFTPTTAGAVNHEFTTDKHDDGDTATFYFACKDNDKYFKSLKTVSKTALIESTVSIGFGSQATATQTASNWVSMGSPSSSVVTFKMNGHGTAPTSFSTTVGSTIEDAPSPEPSEEGYTFDGWFQDETLLTPWVFATAEAGGTKITSETTYIYAKWTPNTYDVTLTASPTGGGTVSGGGTSLGRGSTTTLTATANSGYSFTGFYDGSTLLSDTSPYDYTVTSAASLTAKFTPNKFNVSLSASPTAGGSVTGSGEYDFASTHTLTASANSGYTFEGWYKGDTLLSTDASYSYTLTEASDVSLVAKFKASKYTITVTSSPSEGGSVTGDGEYSHGDTVELTASPNEGYTFDGFYNSASEKLTDNTTMSFTATESMAITAKFSKKKYTVTWKVNGSDITETYEHGETPIYVEATHGTPTKTSTITYTYTWNGGWDPALAPLTGDTTYEPTFDETAIKYTITWKNEDGSIITTDEVDAGTTPTYSGTTPTKTSTAQYSYAFAGWDHTIGPAYSDDTYTATFTPSVRQYTITFKDEDGTTLQEGKWDYGATPKFNGTTPTKTSTAQYSYAFNGWDKSIVSVTGDATYTATYTSDVNKYTITWKNSDGTTLKTEQLDYGATPSYSGTPTKDKDAQYTYTFDKWSPEIASVNGNATYTATYKTTTNQYTVKFVNYDGTELCEPQILDYGKSPKAPDDPVKPSTAKYNYVFAGWDKQITTVKEDVTYTAMFDEELQKYNVKFKNYDDTVLQESKWEYDSLPSYNGDTPKKPSTVDHSFTFIGWDKTISKVTGEQEYKAQFREDPRRYVVTIKLNGHGGDTYTVEVEKGKTIPAPADPTAEGYKFEGWYKDPECTTKFDFATEVVTEDITLYAKWSVIPTPTPTKNNNLTPLWITLGVIGLLILLFVPFIFWKKEYDSKGPNGDRKLRFLDWLYSPVNRLFFRK